MKIPEKVIISGMEYTVYMAKDGEVLLNDEGRRLAGELDRDNTLIKIDTQIQSEQMMKQTLLHEIIHAIAFDRKLDLTEEDLIDQLASGLYQLIHDNPEMFDIKE